MKLKYELQIVEVGDEYAAVPVGEDADKLHALIKLNKESKDMIECIKTSTTPEEVHEKVMKLYPNETRDEVGRCLCDFLNQLIKEGLLEP